MSIFLFAELYVISISANYFNSISEQMENRDNTAWRWVPSLYFIQSIPYIVVMSVAVTMYKTLDISNTEIALYTSWLYLPWVIKPIWSPLVDQIKTKRWWTWLMQLFMGAGFAMVAFTLPMDNFFQYSLAVLWLIAFSSATHDIAADGYYMLALPADKQAFFLGIRSTFYRIGMLSGQGGMVYLAGELTERFGGDDKLAWIWVFTGMGAITFIMGAYHLTLLPKAEENEDKTSFDSIKKEFVNTLIKFFEKKGILLSILFLLTYRLGEAQLVKLSTPFLLDSIEAGGIALSTKELGLLYGTYGVICLTIGGILGGYVLSRNGLKFWIWWMLLSINLPNSVYILLAYFQPENLWVVGAGIAIEQFFYGFGFAGYLFYMIYISDGPYKTAHYALCTGFMALGMMLPGMVSGYIQAYLGYTNFFIWVLLSALPCFVVLRYLKIDPSFGVKNKAE